MNAMFLVQTVFSLIVISRQFNSRYFVQSLLKTLPSADRLSLNSTCSSFSRSYILFAFILVILYFPRLFD